MAVYNPPPKTPAPQGDDQGAQGRMLAASYMLRQHWRMKLITIPVVALMLWYSISIDGWVPLFQPSIFSLLAICLGMFIGTKNLNDLFTQYVKTEGQHTDWKRVTYNAWGLYAIGVIMLYWGVVLAYLTFFAEIPPAPQP